MHCYHCGDRLDPVQNPALKLWGLTGIGTERHTAFRERGIPGKISARNPNSNLLPH